LGQTPRVVHIQFAEEVIASMRPSGRPSVQSVQTGPAIPRRATAHMFAQTELGFSQLIVKIEWGVAYLEKVQGNAVKMPQAELDLAEYFDTARVWLEQLMQTKDKTSLRSIFDGGAILRLAHLEGLCYKVELKVSNDKRRLDLLQRIAACNEVLADLGYAAQVRDAKIAELTAVEEKTEEKPVKETIPHLIDATFLGSQALAFEQVFDFIAAAASYDKARAELRSAITVCLVVVRFKESIGAKESLLENDLLQLQRLEDQTGIRMEHLQGLKLGATPIAVEEQIQPVELSIR